MRRPARLFTPLIALILAAIVTGCGSGAPSSAPPAGAESGTAAEASKELSPSDVALLYLEAMRGNVSGLKEYNPDTEITQEGVFGSANPSLLETWGVSPTAEQEAQLTEAMLVGLSKAEFTVVDEKVDGESATVTVAIQGIDMSSSLATQFEKIGGQITDDTEDEAIVAVLDKAWREAPLVPEPSTVDMMFTAVSDGRWIADSRVAADLVGPYLNFGG